MIGGMRLEGEHGARRPASRRERLGSRDHRAVAQMHAVEIADRVDGLAQTRRRLAGIGREHEVGFGGGLIHTYSRADPRLAFPGDRDANGYARRRRGIIAAETAL